MNLIIFATILSYLQAFKVRLIAFDPVPQEAILLLNKKQIPLPYTWTHYPNESLIFRLETKDQFLFVNIKEPMDAITLFYQFKNNIQMFFHLSTNLPKLENMESTLTILNPQDILVPIYSSYHCENCEDPILLTAQLQDVAQVKVQTPFTYNFKVTQNDTTKNINTEFNYLTHNSMILHNGDVIITQDNDQTDEYWSLIFIICLLGIYFTVKCCISKEKEEDQKKRLKSLDAFRGMALIGMIFVNLGGGGYWFFNHSPWDGVTFADMLFPWFLWIMGSSIVFSLSSTKTSRNEKLAQILVRSAKLFFIGVFIINNAFDLQNMRIPGILQRIAFCYLIVSLMFLYLPKKKILYTRFYFFIQFMEYYQHWIISIIFLVFYLIMTYATKLEDCSRGYTGPGGISEQGSYYDCTGGIARQIDLFVFTSNHVFKSPFCGPNYKCLNFDPEGILGTFICVFHTFLGAWAGIIVKSSQSVEVPLRCLIYGVAGIIFGCLLHFTGGIPFNKQIWSFSFMLFTSGTAFAVFGIFFYLIDHTQIFSGDFFVYLGENSITMYILHEVFSQFFPIGFKNNGNHDQIVLSNSIALISLTVLAWYMHKNKIFLKV